MTNPNTQPASVSSERVEKVSQRPIRRDSLAREAAFRARVEELGGVVLETEWLGVLNRHRVRCAQGHECAPRPRYVLAGGGICRTCSSRDPHVAEAAFRARMEELGATILEPTWLGADHPHRALCPAGHETAPRPSGIKRGEGMCKTCAGTDSRVAEAAFRSRVEELGGIVLEPVWLGSLKPHRIRCSGGHEVRRPPNSIQQGGGLCRTCAGNDPKVAEAEFRARVEQLGGAVLEPTWLGVKAPHRVRCAAGHEITPRPSAIQQGGGICRVCSGKAWDAFYVLLNEEEQIVKLGITSGDPRPRMVCHARDGYGIGVRLMTDLPVGVAQGLERAALSTLRLAGLQPIRGREYFHASALPVILDVADNYPIPDVPITAKKPPKVDEAA